MQTYRLQVGVGVGLSALGVRSSLLADVPFAVRSRGGTEYTGGEE